MIIPYLLLTLSILFSTGNSLILRKFQNRTFRGAGDGPASLVDAGRHRNPRPGRQAPMPFPTGTISDLRFGRPRLAEPFHRASPAPGATGKSHCHPWKNKPPASWPTAIRDGNDSKRRWEACQ